jgi:hypothetical protein
MADNAIPHRHIGRRVVFSLAELDRWLVEQPGVRA